MTSHSCEMTEKLFAGCCQESTNSLLFFPADRVVLDATFSSSKGSRIVFEVVEHVIADTSADRMACVYFRYDNATRVILGEIVKDSIEPGQVVLEVLSDAVMKDSRTDFRIQVRDRSALRFRLTHNSTGTTEVQVRDVSQTGCLIEVARSIRESWEVGDIVNVEFTFDGLSCELDGRFLRIRRTVGLEFLDPVTHTVPKSKELRGIVSALQREYLKNRIPL